MNTLNEWLDAYAVCHQHPTNKMIHKICVPAIVWSVLALVWSLPTIKLASGSFEINWAWLAVIVSAVFYFRLSLILGIAMVCMASAFIGLNTLIQSWGLVPVWAVALAVFVVAWIGQFIGHYIEGRKPSFFEDLQFLLVGPAWVINAWIKLR